MGSTTMPAPFPDTYEQWRRCITVECGIPLTAAFIAQRLAVWRNAQAEETLRFRRLYRDPHWRSVVGWFEQAELELSAAASPHGAPKP
jgi:hypothetical protein